MGISLQFLGAVGTVTGSQFLVRTPNATVLVDCGMFQGSPEEVSRNRIPFAFDAGELDALMLTHAHLDHCGRIPALVRAGYHGPIISTAATSDLAEIVCVMLPSCRAKPKRGGAASIRTRQLPATPTCRRKRPPRSGRPRTTKR